MPALASHRKPRTRMRSTVPAVGLTSAALASVTLLSSQSAMAAPAPKPSIEEVQKRVDDLYRQAGTATQKYNQAKEATDRQKSKVDTLLDSVAERTEKLNDARRTLGNYAAAQYRNGGLAPTATFFLADDPQSFFDQTHLMDRMAERQQQAVTEFRTQQAKVSKQRAEAVESLETLTESQADLRTSKQNVQTKLTEARTLLSKLTAEEKARLAELERKKEAEAKRKAAELAKKQAAARKEAEQKAKESGSGGTETGSGSGSDTGSGSSASTKAEKVLAFARAQIGKPYVWGATGPASYDCSGLTQAAWKAAGVDLPRTTWDQVNVGTRVATADLQPGDLVFFYDDISHVGIYKGDGMMIHAPKPGANVREESIYYMPIYGSVRPA
ncbi:C40 family peptidase [Streptomyces drozdowiczii]|uniref:NlpC/P60 family protein n=1 Tax=Streptomyces drozdowiczii TaxID=202862 RepID=A0ABY6PSH2_9ACTN|nr:C40 family peptidase [Streptomyces drozdowiczii]MCX0245587.1 NlpC/P60 family protein [Streptomyces drozdowiczii]UZK54786.1 NlpC/P60 family protein [Streptomyces drozdowiczii]